MNRFNQKLTVLFGGLLMFFTASKESSGPEGNFGNNGAERRSPTGSPRVGGLTEPDRTRAYFLSDIGWDSYNTDRVTIAKGPNAILSGLGSPAVCTKSDSFNASNHGGKTAR